MNTLGLAVDAILKRLLLLVLLLVPTAMLSQTAHQVTLTWTAPTTTLTVGYNVYRCPSSCTGTNAVKIQGSIAQSQTGYIDTAVTAGATYVYYVTAYDVTGANSESTASNTFTATIPSGGGTSGQTPPVIGLKGSVQ